MYYSHINKSLAIGDNVPDKRGIVLWTVASGYILRAERKLRTTVKDD
jgi:hypothetical protein